MTTNRKLATRVAIYARVSSEQQAQEQTIASQVAALRQRIAEDGWELPDELCFLDNGVSGSTLMRPALERLRDAAYVGDFQKLYVHSPDRLARRYAYQVLLVDELSKHGVEIVFLNRAIGVTPEEDLLLQMQGMFAEYERAKIMERSRRGKRHAATRGSVNVLSGAPYGYRYVAKRDGQGQASYEVHDEQAAVVEQIFAWVGRDRVSIGEVSRRLKERGIASPRGKAWWDRTSVWGILKNPAYQGSAAFGKTRTGPRRPQLRPPRSHTKVSRRAGSNYDTSPAEQITIPVPAIVPAELFASVQEQLAANRLRGRERRRGAKHLLQDWSNVNAAVTPTTASRSVAPTRKARCGMRTIVVWEPTPIALAASASARTRKCAPTNSTRPCGTTHVNCFAIHSCCARNTNAGSRRPSHHRPNDRSRSSSARLSARGND